MDYQGFFSRKPDKVAPDLLGRFLVRETESGILTAKITGTGAYEEGNETPSREGMKYAPGSLFLMPFRGSRLFNIATDRIALPSCVEIRSILLDDKTIDGAGKVTKFYELSPEKDGMALGEELQINGEKADESKISRQEGDTANCLGYFYLND